MRALLVILLIIVVGWAGWYLWSKSQNSNNVALNNYSNTASSSPLETIPGYGGQGPEPSNYTIATATPISTPKRTAVSTPKPTPRATPSPTAAPFVAFRTISGLNGFSENGVMAITSTADGKTQLNFNVPDAPNTGSQPMLIYSGPSCLGSTQAAYALNPLINGSSMTILPISPQNFVSGSGGLQLVIQMAMNNNTRVACAVIR